MLSSMLSRAAKRGDCSIVESFVDYHDAESVQFKALWVLSWKLVATASWGVFSSKA